MNLVDKRIDDALLELGPGGDNVVVVCFGTPDGTLKRTSGYTDLFGWRQIVISRIPPWSWPNKVLDRKRIDHIDVLHLETKKNDWNILRQIDLERFRPRLIRLRRANLNRADLFSAVRHLGRHGYDIEWFYDELIGILPVHAEAIPAATSDQAEARVAATARDGDQSALYVMSYNFPDQFRLWLESVERADPALLATPTRFLLDNSVDPSTRAGYDLLCRRYGFTVLRHGNLGITGGRLFCARQFDELSQLDALFWFEDDMLLHPPGAPLCRNGLPGYVPRLSEVSRAIVRREELEFLMLSFTEFFGDHHLNWAWYHLNHELRDRIFPDGTFRTHIRHSGVEQGVSYIVGNVHYDNWPTYMTRKGNTQMFLEGELRDPWEGVYMERGFNLQHSGEMKGGVLLASPINHSRSFIYPAAERREF